MSNNTKVYLPQDIYVFIKKCDKKIIDNYLLSRTKIKKEVKLELKNEFQKFYDINKLVVVPGSDPEQRLDLSMNFLNKFLDIYTISTLKAHKEKKDFLKNFLLISNNLTIFLKQKV